MSTYNPDVFIFLQDCPRGLFGYNCINNCSVHCKEQMKCDRVTGHCFNDCQPEWGDHTFNTSTFLILLYLNLLNQLNDEYRSTVKACYKGAGPNLIMKC